MTIGVLLVANVSREGNALPFVGLKKHSTISYYFNIDSGYAIDPISRSKLSIASMP